VSKRQITSILILVASLFVSSCAGDILEKNYKAYPSESNQGNGFVTIFRESHFVGMGADAKIKVNALTYGYVLNGSGIRIGLPQGDVQIEVYTEANLFREHLSIPLSVESGKEYYVELAAQTDPMYTTGGAGYLLGSLKSHVHQYCGSGWCAAIEDVGVVTPKLQKIHLRAR
jgi:hypothetical protein